MDKKELTQTLKQHALWVADNGGRIADLRGADLQDADLRGANLRGANLQDAYLQDAYLRGADLRGAYLQDAYLRGAYLCGADLQGCNGNRSEIKSIFICAAYPITYTAEVLQIGCEQHPISDWLEFDSERISGMDGDQATSFWAEWKDTIFLLIEKSPATPTTNR